MRKIYLVQVQNVIDGKIFLPCAIGSLWSFLSNKEEISENYELGDCFFTRGDRDEFLSEMVEPDILGLSTYVWNYEYSKKFAEAVKRKWPQCLIVMGGPHVPYKTNFQESLPYVDLVVTYEGEEQFYEILVERLRDNPNYEDIVGVITPQTKLIQKRTRLKKLDNLSSPCLNGFYDRLIEKNRDLAFNLVIETNRGCPYSCTFCDMQDDFYQKISIFEMNKIKEELLWAAQRKIPYIDCADSNFGILKRDIEIAKYVAYLKVNYGYPKMFNFTSAKNQPIYVKEIQRILGNVGIDRGISISLQSFDKDVQHHIKRFNLPQDHLKKTIHSYKEEGLESFVEIILGLPGETKRSWIRGITNLLDMNYDGALLIHPLSIVPNTPFADPSYIEKYKLKYTVTKSPAQGFNYGTESAEEREQICYASSSMTAEEWIECYIYGKCLVGAHFFHGFSYFIAKYFQRQYEIPPGYFYEKLLDYSKASTGFLGREYREIKIHLEQSLFELRPWGRKVLGEKDLYWSDQAAAAINIFKNLNAFYQEVVDFIHVYFPFVKDHLLLDLIKFNEMSLENPYQSLYRFEQFQYNWLDFFFDNRSLKKQKSVYQFKGKKWESVRDHALHVYWYGRKSRRCFVDIQRDYLNENVQQSPQ